MTRESTRCTPSMKAMASGRGQATAGGGADQSFVSINGSTSTGAAVSSSSWRALSYAGFQGSILKVRGMALV
jgi:hypothetical protein